MAKAGEYIMTKGAKRIWQSVPKANQVMIALGDALPTPHLTFVRPLNPGLL
jgi:hypothetical protein